MTASKIARKRFEHLLAGDNDSLDAVSYIENYRIFADDMEDKLDGENGFTQKTVKML